MVTTNVFLAHSLSGLAWLDPRFETFYIQLVGSCRVGRKKTDTQMFGPWFVSNVYFLDGTQPGEKVNDGG